MRTDARKFSAAIVAALLLVALPATASAAVSPPTISSQFTPASIGSGGTTALSFTITNPNASGTLHNVGITDTLPTGLTVDNPNGQNGTCGSASTVTAAAGGSTISLTGGTLAAGANCTIQVSVTSTTPGTYKNSTGSVTSTEAPASTADTQTLTVFGLPTVSVTGPTENAVYAFGQTVIAHYTCADAAGAPGIAACSGDADNGTPIDTSSDGANTFSVSAISSDGAITTQTIDYVVLPDNRITVSKPKGHTGGTVTFNVRVPDAGKLTAKLTHNGQTFGRVVVKLTSDGTTSFTIRLNATGRKLFKTAARAKPPKPVSLTLTVTFVPVLGTAGRPTVSTLSIKP